MPGAAAARPTARCELFTRRGAAAGAARLRRSTTPTMRWRSAGGSTGCRWRSSWPRPGCARCRRAARGPPRRPVPAAHRRQPHRAAPPPHAARRRRLELGPARRRGTPPRRVAGGVPRARSPPVAAAAYGTWTPGRWTCSPRWWTSRCCRSSTGPAALPHAGDDPGVRAGTPGRARARSPASGPPTPPTSWGWPRPPSRTCAAPSSWLARPACGRTRQPARRAALRRRPRRRRHGGTARRRAGAVLDDPGQPRRGARAGCGRPWTPRPRTARRRPRPSPRRCTCSTPCWPAVKPVTDRAGTRCMAASESSDEHPLLALIEPAARAVHRRHRRRHWPRRAAAGPPRPVDPRRCSDVAGAPQRERRRHGRHAQRRRRRGRRLPRRSGERWGSPIALTSLADGTRDVRRLRRRASPRWRRRSGCMQRAESRATTPAISGSGSPPPAAHGRRGAGPGPSCREIPRSRHARESGAGRVVRPARARGPGAPEGDLDEAATPVRLPPTALGPRLRHRPAVPLPCWRPPIRRRWRSTWRRPEAARAARCDEALGRWPPRPPDMPRWPRHACRGRPAATGRLGDAGDARPRVARRRRALRGAPDDLSTPTSRACRRLLRAELGDERLPRPPTPSGRAAGGRRGTARSP